MNALIIEDEPLAAERLQVMLEDIDPAIRVLGKIGSVREAVKWLMQYQADIIFLDIQLSDGLSFSIFEQVSVSTPVILTTAYDQYAIKAFEVNSIAYLLKPVRKADLQESLRKLRNLKSAFSVDFEALLAQIQGRQPEYRKRFLIQIGDKIRKVEVSDIAYFHIFEKGCYLRTFQGSDYPVDFTLDRLETMIDPARFFRINRRYLVNMDSISNMVLWSRSRIKLTLKPDSGNDSDTVVSIDRASDFRRWMNG